MAESLVGNTAGYVQIASYTAAAKAASPYTTATITGNPTTDQGILGACNTTLLFPFVTNQAGYDTGFAIANTSNLTTSPASGSCALAFYPSAGLANATPAAVTVAAGAVSTFVLSGTEAGFQGFVVATCSFSNAHGFAFLEDGVGANGGLSQGYLAPVTASGGANTANLPF